MPLDVETHALTDTGLQRSHNEDDFDIVDEAGLYIVADGMGGHASGQVASRLAVENMRRYITELSVRPGHELHSLCVQARALRNGSQTQFSGQTNAFLSNR